MPGQRMKQRKYYKEKDYCTEKEIFSSDNDSVIVQAFQQYRKELDNKHDKYERIVKLSRDITIESKRVIFSLHALCRSTDITVETKKLSNTFQKILDQFKAISKELVGEDPYQFLRAYSPGLQEYVEAVTLYHYLVGGVLYNWNQFQKDLEFPISVREEDKSFLGNPKLEDSLANARPHYSKTVIPLSEYLLGVQDLTGELMRYCINSFAAGRVDNGFLVCNFIKMLYMGMLHIGNNHVKEFGRKQYTFKQSLLKMENACYTMHVRGSEILKDSFTVAIDEPLHEEYDDFF